MEYRRNANLKNVNYSRVGEIKVDVKLGGLVLGFFSPESHSREHLFDLVLSVDDAARLALLLTSAYRIRVSEQEASYDPKTKPAQ